MILVFVPDSAHEASNLPVRYAGVLWATRRQYRDNPQYVAQINELLENLYREFGWRSRLAAPVAGRYLYYKLQEQQKLLDSGWTYEPPTSYETNFPDGPRNSTHIPSVLGCSKGRSKSRDSVVVQMAHESAGLVSSSTE